MRIIDKRISNMEKVCDVARGGVIYLGGDFYTAIDNDDPKARKTAFVNLQTGGLVNLLWSLEVEKVNAEMTIK